MGKIPKRKLVFAGLKRVIAGVTSRVSGHFLEGAIRH